MSVSIVRDMKGSAPAVVGLVLSVASVLPGCVAAPAASVQPTIASSPSGVASSSPAGFRSATSSVAPPATPAGPPAGVVAIGHSGLTGEGTGSEGGTPPVEKSWATGSAPAVNSVWLRLRAIRPDLAGEAVNRAEGGAPASALPAQARAALQAAPNPALVIISTIDSDILCDGNDPAHVPEFGASVAETLEILTDAAPAARILVVGQLGRPSIAFVEKLVATDPAMKDEFTGSGMCDFLDSNGHPQKAHFDELTAIIEGYEAEQARVCATFARCRTDGGVRAKYQDVLENFSPDWNHLNVKGQAAEAELIWPVVEDLLGL